MHEALLRTSTGRLIDVTRPLPEDIEIVDIAQGLSHACRFAGQIPQFYSVSQHSVLVAELVDPPFKLAALLHDASEAYLGDLVRGLKHHPLLAGYRQIESHLQRTIEARFGCPRESTRDVKMADNLAACFERFTLLESHRAMFSSFDVLRMIDQRFIDQRVEHLAPFIPRLPRTWAPWNPEEGRWRFLAAFAVLKMPT